MRFRIGESREELIEAVGGADVLDKIKAGKYYGDRGHSIMVKGKQVMFDANAPTNKKPLLVWNAERGPVIVCNDDYDTLSRITPLEALLYRAGHLSLNQLNNKYHHADRRE